MSDCLNRILSKYPDLDKELLTKIVNEVEEARKNNPVDSEFSKYIPQMIKFAKEDSIQRKIEKYDSIIKQKKNLDFISQPAFKGDPNAAIHALLVGADRLSMGGNASIDNLQKSIKMNHERMFISELDKKGLLDVVKQQSMDRDIAIELHKLQQKEVNVEGLKQGPALEAAKVIDTVQKSLLMELKLANSPVRELEGRVARNSHDPQKIRGDLTLSEDQAFAKWSNDIMPLLDKEKTFLWNKDNPQGQQKFLRAAFDDIVQDIAGTGGSGSGKRSIHFQDGGAWYDYNSMYGKQSLLETVKKEISSTSKQAGLMSKLGTDYKKGWENLNKAVEKSVANDPVAKKNYLDGKEFAEKRFQTLLGVSDIPGNTWYAKAGETGRGFVRMGIYGGSAFMTPADIAPSASMIRSNTNQSFLGGMLDSIHAFVSMFDGDQKKEVTHRIGIFANDYLDSVSEKLTVADSVPGMLTNAERNFHKLTLLGPITELADHGMARQASFILGKHASTPFNELSPRARAGLERFGFTEKNWEVARKHTEDLGHGVKALTPAAMQEIPDDIVKQALKDEGRSVSKPEIERYRRDLTYKVTGFIRDNLDIAVPKPGAREKSVLLQGTKADSANGQLLRFFSEAKSFMLSMYRVVARTALSDPNQPATKLSDVFKLQGDKSGLMGLSLSATAMAYVGWAAKEMVLGKTPPDPRKLSTWNEAFLRGGTGLMFTDFLAKDYTGSHMSPLADLAGPSFGKANDLLEIWSKAIHGKTDHERKGAGKDLLNLIGRSTPYNNVPFVRTGLNYLFLYNLNEFMNPGNAARLEKNARDKGQSFLFSPQNRVH